MIVTYDDAVTVLGLMKGNLSTYQTEVGATAAEITWVPATLANLNYIASYCATLDADKKAAFDIKQSYFAGEKGSAVSDFPTIAAAVVPNPPLTGGVLFVLRDMAKRYKLGPGYTKEIGIALGIEEASKEAVNPGDVKPTIEVFGAQTGHHFSVVVAGREDSDQWEVQILRSGSTTWDTVKTATGKSADVSVTLTTPGQPEQLQVRVQLIKANQPYGQLSDAATVTVNP
jgi:hypothetical protein